MIRAVEFTRRGEPGTRVGLKERARMILIASGSRGGQARFARPPGPTPGPPPGRAAAERAAAAKLAELERQAEELRKANEASEKRIGELMATLDAAQTEEDRQRIRSAIEAERSKIKRRGRRLRNRKQGRDTGASSGGTKTRSPLKIGGDVLPD